MQSTGCSWAVRAPQLTPAPQPRQQVTQTGAFTSGKRDSEEDVYLGQR